MKQFIKNSAHSNHYYPPLHHVQIKTPVQLQQLTPLTEIPPIK